MEQIQSRQHVTFGSDKIWDNATRTRNVYRRPIIRCTNHRSSRPDTHIVNTYRTFVPRTHSKIHPEHLQLKRVCMPVMHTGNAYRWASDTQQSAVCAEASSVSMPLTIENLKEVWKGVWYLSKDDFIVIPQSIRMRRAVITSSLLSVPLILCRLSRRDDDTADKLLTNVYCNTSAQSGSKLSRKLEHVHPSAVRSPRSTWPSILHPFMTCCDFKEISDMSDISEAITGDTLLIYDLDNTVYEPVGNYGSDQWFFYLNSV